MTTNLIFLTVTLPTLNSSVFAQPVFSMLVLGLAIWLMGPMGIVFWLVFATIRGILILGWNHFAANEELWTGESFAESRRIPRLQRLA